MSFETLFRAWQRDDVAGQFVVRRKFSARPADWQPLPPDLPRQVVQALAAQGIARLYAHQSAVWEAVRAGEHVALVTGTASGKTLAYNLPVLAALEATPPARALYLFPTKALAQDQLKTLQAFGAPAAVYDGDTPPHLRGQVRRTARILLSNPDMLHTGILPHHTNWEQFFRGLRFVVLDEMHTYRGVFGAHVANVLRRLKRIAAFYGAAPQFILTSATIANPRELAERLIEAPVYLIDRDGSPRGERHYWLYNPPLLDPALGLRASLLDETRRLAEDLRRHGLQSVVFVRSRRMVELLLMRLGRDPRIRGYRSGYLPAERREIEAGLRTGTVRLVVATNALELGVDIGGLDAALLAGYPGSLASFWQQSGRAGRGQRPAMTVLVAGSGPVDQFLLRHPEFLFERSPERALLHPDHLVILLEHLRCALFELPFAEKEGFGGLDGAAVAEFLDFLTEGGEAYQQAGRTYWMADAYPAADVSLRSASPERVTLQVHDGGRPRVIGEVDRPSAPWMVHPRAVYLHEGRQYYVQTLDLERNLAELVPVMVDYLTEPLRETKLQVDAVAAQAALTGGSHARGEVRVTTQVQGFRKRSLLDGANLGEETLALPAETLSTQAWWLTVDAATQDTLRADGMWGNDANAYGADWPHLRELVRARDDYRCQICGTPESGRAFHVHHIQPFRSFADPREANRLENLITLCPACHRRTEQNVRVRSGLAGLGYALGHLAALFLMCDPGDLGVSVEWEGGALQSPGVVIYEQIPGGLGFSAALFDLAPDLLQAAQAHIAACPCEDGCPACTGPGGENGAGGKAQTLALLAKLIA